MKRKAVNIVIAALLLFIGISACIDHTVAEWTERETFTSPEKTNTIIVQYDLVSRPTVYKKTLRGKEKIWEYHGAGFNETVHFDVEWVTEDQFIFSYTDRNPKYNEEYLITIP